MQPHIKEVKTRDGSVTWYDETTQEYYHSLAGAYEEALKKHVEPVLKYLKENNRLKDKIIVMDYCFGLGYNAFVFVEEIRKFDHDLHIHIICIDKDPDVIERAKEIFKETLDKYINSKNKVIFDLRIGDAAEETLKINDKLDVCFFDPFSPKKRPHLWDAKIFDKIYQLMNNKSILSTYSCAKSVRDKLKSAGFIVQDGPKIGIWHHSTLGVKDEIKV